MRTIATLTDQTILGLPGLSDAAPRLTARAVVQRADGLYAVMYARKFNLHTLPGGGMDPGESPKAALRRELMEEIGCACETITPIGIVEENRAHADYTQRSWYFFVTTKGPTTDASLTADEAANGACVQWCTWEEMVERICGPVRQTNQQKFLQARDKAVIEALASAK